MTEDIRSIPSDSLVHSSLPIVRVVGSGNLTAVSGIILRELLATVSRRQHWGVVVMAIGVGCDCRVDWRKELGVVVVENLARDNDRYGG